VAAGPAPPVLIIGSAHVIDLAAPLRRALAGRPLDGIAVELDAERANVLLHSPPGGRPNRGGPFLFRVWALLQRRLGDVLGAGVGGEMRAAAELAREWGLPLYCIDDPIRETIARLLGSISMRERVELLVGGIVGLFLPSRVVSKQIAEYTRGSGEQLAQMRQAFPALTGVLLDDRNAHMAERIETLRRHGKFRLAVVVGDAHLPGLAGELERRGIPTERIALAQLTAPTAS
jgi:pheromone shutdown protein TraB